MGCQSVVGGKSGDTSETQDLGYDAGIQTVLVIKDSTPLTGILTLKGRNSSCGAV